MHKKRKKARSYGMPEDERAFQGSGIHFGSVSVELQARTSPHKTVFPC